MISDVFFAVLHREISNSMKGDVDASAISEVFTFLKGAFPAVRDLDLATDMMLGHVPAVLGLFMSQKETLERVKNVALTTQEILGHRKTVRQLLTQAKNSKQKPAPAPAPALKLPEKLRDFKASPDGKKKRALDDDAPAMSSAQFVARRLRVASFPPHLDEIALRWSAQVHKKLQEPDLIAIEKDSMGFNISVSATVSYQKKCVQKPKICANTTQDFIDGLLSETPFERLQTVLEEEVRQHSGTLRGRIANAALSTYVAANSNLPVTQKRPDQFGHGLG